MRKRCERLLEDLKDCLKIKPIKFSNLVYKDIPQTTGIYILSEKDERNVVYVGITSNLRERVYRNHLMGNAISSNLKKKLMEIKKITKEEVKDYIKKHGMEKFLEKEKHKWTCPNCDGIVTCHGGMCLNCGFIKFKN